MAGIWKQWGIEQSKKFVGEMYKLGVDLVDCSSGGNWVKQKIPLMHGYQVHPEVSIIFITDLTH